MTDLTVQIQGVTLRDIASDPAQYNDETLAAALEVIKRVESQTRDMKGALSGHLMARLQDDNATKMKFLDVDGAEREVTLKSPPRKLNDKIDNIEQFITDNGFTPETFGSYQYVPYGWSKVKEIRKQGGTVQLVCDELYTEGKPSLDIK